MSVPKIIVVLLVAALSFALVTGVVEAASKPGIGAPQVQKAPPSVARDVQVAPTGDGPADDEECAKYQRAINSWADAEVKLMEAGKEREARRAKFNVEGLIKDATDRGCFIIY